MLGRAGEAVNEWELGEGAQENDDLLLAKNGFVHRGLGDKTEAIDPSLTLLFLQSRLYPVVPGNSRVPEKDIRVGDYIIPKNVSRANGPFG